MDMSQKITETDGYQTKSNTPPKLPISLSDHPSLIGIIRLPLCSVEEQEVNITLPYNDNNTWKMINQKVDMATNIEQITIEDGGFTVPKEKITDFFPYCYYILTDGECEPLIMYPQYMPTTSTVKGRYSLSHQPIERYYVEGYKGDNIGSVYNITNVNQMMLPCGTNEGINYMSANANTIAQSRKSAITENVLGAVGNVGTSIGAMLSGNALMGIGIGLNGLSSSISGLSQIKNIDSRNKDLTLTPNSITSYGTPSTRNAFDLNNVRVLKYSVSDNVKQKALNFSKRFGNKYNNYDTIDLKSYKGYIKFISPDIDSNIDNIYINKIIEILERGIYIE